MLSGPKPTSGDTGAACPRREKHRARARACPDLDFPGLPTLAAARAGSPRPTPGLEAIDQNASALAREGVETTAPVRGVVG